MLTPFLRALSQMDDRAFLSVVLHSVLWSALAFVLLAAGLGWGTHAEVLAPAESRERLRAIAAELLKRYAREHA